MAVSALLRSRARRWWAVALVAVVTIATLAIGAASGGAAPVTPTTETIAVPAGPGRTGTIDLDASLFVPPVTPAPAVIVAHGFGGSKESVRSDAERLVEAGFVVLTYSARGFGRSGGLISLDSLDYEVADARELVTWLAKQPQVRLDAPGDPRVGVTGGSYGGALSLMLAGTDPRIDAVAAVATWNNLQQSLFPDARVGASEGQSAGSGSPEGQSAGSKLPARTPAYAPYANGADGVFKQAWTASLLTSILGGGGPDAGDDAGPDGTEGSAGDGAGPSTAGNGAGPSHAADGANAGGGDSTAPAGAADNGANDAALCGKLAPDLCAAYLQVATTGRSTPAMAALLARSSPAAVDGHITAPTLLVQGEQDTLFGLDQADANARAIAAAGTTVAVSWYPGGHSGGGLDDQSQNRITDWFRYYLAGQGAKPSLDFRYAVPGPLSQRGTPRVRTLELPRYPGLDSGRTPVTRVTVHGPAQTIMHPPGGSPAALTSLPGVAAAASGVLGGLSSLPGQVALYTSDPVAEPLVVTGSIPVTLTVSRLPTGTSVGVGAADPAAGSSGSDGSASASAAGGSASSGAADGDGTAGESDGDGTAGAGATPGESGPATNDAATNDTAANDTAAGAATPSDDGSAVLFLSLLAVDPGSASGSAPDSGSGSEASADADSSASPSAAAGTDAATASEPDGAAESDSSDAANSVGTAAPLGGGPAGGAVAPIRLDDLPADGTPVTVTAYLPAVAFQVDAGQSLGIRVATTDQAFPATRTAAIYRVALSSSAGTAQTLEVPTAGGSRIRSADSAEGWAIGLAALLVAGVVALILVGRDRRRGAAVRPAVAATARATTAVIPAAAAGPASARHRSHPAQPAASPSTGDPADTTVIPAAAPPPLVVAGLQKRYPGGVTAVADVTFTVRRGQVLGLLGPNGAGKTTTLRMVMGLITPTAGEVRLFGEPVTPGAPVLTRVGSFVEGSGFLPHLSGRANLDLYWRATGRPADESYLDQALAIAGLDAAIRRKVRTYSQGMRQRLAIAQAMLGLPELLILDEPTNGLDPPQIHAMREVLRRYAAGGRTVVVSSHLLSEVEQTCTDVVIVSRGKTIAAGTVAEMVAHSGDLMVTTTEPETARRALATLGGLGDTEIVAGGLAVDRGSVPVADLMRALVEAHVDVAALAPRNRLEEVFLDLIAARSAEEGPRT